MSDLGGFGASYDEKIRQLRRLDHGSLGLTLRGRGLTCTSLPDLESGGLSYFKKRLALAELESFGGGKPYLSDVERRLEESKSLGGGSAGLSDKEWLAAELRALDLKKDSNDLRLDLLKRRLQSSSTDSTFGLSREFLRKQWELEYGGISSKSDSELFEAWLKMKRGLQSTGTTLKPREPSSSLSNTNLSQGVSNPPLFSWGSGTNSHPKTGSTSKNSPSFNSGGSYSPAPRTTTSQPSKSHTSAKPSSRTSAYSPSARGATSRPFQHQDVLSPLKWPSGASPSTSKPHQASKNVPQRTTSTPTKPPHSNTDPHTRSPSTARHTPLSYPQTPPIKPPPPGSPRTASTPAQPSTQPAGHRHNPIPIATILNSNKPSSLFQENSHTAADLRHVASALAGTIHPLAEQAYAEYESQPIYDLTQGSGYDNKVVDAYLSLIDRLFFFGTLSRRVIVNLRTQLSDRQKS